MRRLKPSSEFRVPSSELRRASHWLLQSRECFQRRKGDETEALPRATPVRSGTAVRSVLFRGLCPLASPSAVREVWQPVSLASSAVPFEAQAHFAMEVRVFPDESSPVTCPDELSRATCPEESSPAKRLGRGLGRFCAPARVWGVLGRWLAVPHPSIRWSGASAPQEPAFGGRLVEWRQP